MTKKFFYIVEIIILLILISLVAFVFMAYFDNKNGNLECVSDPLVYGAKGLTEANHANISCSCILLGRLASPTLYFDAYGSNIKYPEPLENSYKSINTTIFNNFK
jgi:hypothetical protein